MSPHDPKDLCLTQGKNGKASLGWPPHAPAPVPFPGEEGTVRRAGRKEVTRASQSLGFLSGDMTLVGTSLKEISLPYSCKNMPGKRGWGVGG